MPKEKTISYGIEYYIHAKIYPVGTEFNQWVSDKLRENGWNQAELAKRAKLRPGTISNIMTGARAVSLDSVKKIAHAFREPLAVAYAKAGFLKNAEVDSTIEEKLLLLFRLLPENEKQIILRQVQGIVLLLEQQGIIKKE